MGRQRPIKVCERLSQPGKGWQFLKNLMMKIEDQVCSLEQAKKLKQLGVIQQSIWFWEIMKPSEIEGLASERLSVHFNCGHPISESLVEERLSAFTVAELGVMLPSMFATRFGVGVWICFNDQMDEDDSKYYPENFHCDTESSTEAHARATMLIYLIETGKITRSCSIKNV